MQSSGDNWAATTDVRCCVRDGMPLCLEIGDDIARRSRELAQFPPDYLLLILDGNEIDVAHFLFTCTINQTAKSSIF
jgi:hypothetical protein